MDRPLPSVPHRPTPNPRDAQRAAEDLVRQQIAQIYDESEPNQPHANHVDQIEEGVDVITPEAGSSQSMQPQGVYAHTLREEKQYDWQAYHTAWQNYYQQYYQRYYLEQLHQHRQQLAAQATPVTPESTQQLAGFEQNPQLITGGQPPVRTRRIAALELKNRLLSTVQKRASQARRSQHFMPIAAALVVGFLFLFLQFNRTLTAQVKYYVSPGTITNEGSSIIIDTNLTASVGPEPKLIIPKINVDVPIVYDEKSYDESKVQKALERGVVHYGNAALPGQIGNNVMVGHSSNDLFDDGKYKFAFVLLDRLENGDIFMINHEGKRYIYKIFNKATIKPSDFSLINITPDKPVVTLITCTPPGTALYRLVVQAEQISPEPNADAVAAAPTEGTGTLPGSIAGNSPTLFERIKNIFN